MRHFRNIIAMAVAALCFCGVRADGVTSEMAMAAANAWMVANPSFCATGSAVSAVAEYDDDGTLLWWTVATSGGGAIFIAPETSIEPVLAAVPKYSGSLSAAHPLRAILSVDVAKRLAANAAATVVTTTPSVQPRLLTASVSPSSSSANITNAEIAAAVSAAESRWARYATGTRSGRLRLGAAAPSNVIAVVPGFGEEDGNDYLRFWNQSHPFNLYTPENSVCGCVATAGAAILQYFGSQGLAVNVTRKCTYNEAPVQLTTISATNHYDWSMLPLSMGGQNSSYDEEAVEATLGRATYDVGVCVGMNYTLKASGAQIKDLATAFKEDFDFFQAKYVEIGTNGNFSTIYEDLCRTNPVVLGIRKSKGFSAHAVLAVGYGKDDNDVSYTRIFMGWGGVDDAWYNLPEIQEYDVVTDAIVSMSLNQPIGHKTIAAAKAAALENHKPLLIISGTVGDTNTVALLDNIEASGHAGDFEIYFASYASDPYADQNPSYGIFNPLVFDRDADNRWAFYNGRLAYSADTNDVVDASIVAETLEIGLTDWGVAYENYLHLLEASSNGVVVATANSLNIFYEDLLDTVIGVSEDYFDYDYDFTSGVIFKRTKGMAGELYENVFTNGQIVVLESPLSVVTNDDQGIVWECAGWLLNVADETGYETIDAGDGTVAEFTVEANSSYELRWLWIPSALRLTTETTTGGSVSPKGTAWYPYGDTVTIVATASANAQRWRFSHWSGDTDGCSATGNSVEVPMDVPRDRITAHFLREAQGSALSIASDPADVKPGIAYAPYQYMLAYGENRLENGTYAIFVPDMWEDATGGVWRCTGWTVTGCVETNGANEVAEFELSGDALLTWQWEVVPNDDPVIPPLDPAVPPIGPVEGGVTNSAIVIYSTNDVQMAVETRVSNAVAGYWYSIWAADEVNGPYSYVTGAYTGEAKRKVEDPVPEILSLVIVFDPVESAKFYRVVVTEKEPK